MSVAFTSAIEFFGFLILTLLGFTLPLLAILLSLFPDGIKLLKIKYENQKKQSEENIKKELLKKESEQDLDYKAVKKNLKALEIQKKRAAKKLDYLNPKKQILFIACLLLISAASLACLIANFHLAWNIIFIFICFLAFLYSLYIFWSVLCVIVETTEAVSDSKKNTENKIIELLSTLAESSGDKALFLNSLEISVNFYNKKLTENKKFTFSTNRKYDIPVSIENGNDRMAKNIEVGFEFPPHFLIEKSSNISIYTGTDIQIVRFNEEFIQGNEDNLQGNVGLTFLNSGIYDIKTFIKGENLKNRFLRFTIEVID